jgi:hypothetical protein
MVQIILFHLVTMIHFFITSLKIIKRMRRRCRLLFGFMGFCPFFISIFNAITRFPWLIIFLSLIRLLS